MKSQVQVGSIDALVCDPRLHDVLSIVKAARNGVVFGAKVRFPHAFVTVMMFGKGSFLSRLLVILQLTRQHAKTLALYASAYKAIMIVLRNGLSHGEETLTYPWIAGGLAGAFVFDKRNPINEQIVLYAFSRAMASLIIPKVRKIVRAQQDAISRVKTPAASTFNRSDMIFRLFAALSWATAMGIYTNSRGRVSQSMLATMDYLYASCEKWDGIRTFISI